MPRYNTARPSEQGGGVGTSEVVGISKGAVAVRWRSTSISYFPQNTITTRRLTPRSREVISSAFRASKTAFRRGASERDSIPLLFTAY